MMHLSRYSALAAAVTAACGTTLASAQGGLHWGYTAAAVALAARGVYDVVQRRHSILRSYPLLGHARFALEKIRPEVRQYFFESNADELPFSREQRNVVYQRAKNQPDSLAFGTKLDVKKDGHEWLAHSMQPSTIASSDFRVLVGADRTQPYPLSVFNISAMSFGALSANAIRALNKGAKMGGFAHDTGEGSLSPYHREHGGDIIWELGSGYFGCRTPDGRFDPAKFADTATEPQVKMIEIKLSQGAKPGHGGVLPSAKVTAEIAATRGVPLGQDCVSPAAHSEFSNPLELLNFVERLRNLSGGKPTGFKLCIGQPWEFLGIVKAMLQTGILPDFIVVDGAEGGTGAAPVEFADHVGAPLQEGLLLVHNALVGANLRDRIKIGASGKIITAFDAAKILAIGADYLMGARSYMMAIGCIQSNSCSTGTCPTGVATQDPLRQRAIDVGDKGTRVFNYHRNTLHALQELLQAAGLNHPSELRAHHIVRRTSSFEVRVLSNLLGYLEPGDLVEGRLRLPVFENWWPVARADSFGLNAAACDKPVIWLQKHE
jgi:glutamate synthase domain-containing protein 2